MYPVLRRRGFVLLWIGGFVSAGGDWLLALALPFYVYQRTGSAAASTALFMLHILPQVLFGSVAGVFVDRWDRRRTMLIADLTRAALLVLLLPVAGDDQWLWLSYPIVALEATISQFFRPAKGSLLPRLVAKDELLSANSLSTVSDSMLRLIAPAAGGILFERFGLASVLIVDSATYLLSALMIALLRVPGSEEPAGSTEAAASRWVRFWRDWLEGLHYVRNERLLRTVFVVTGVSGVAAGMYGPLLQIFIQDMLQAGADVLGLMVTATGIGTMLTGLVLGRVGEAWPALHLAAWGQVLFGVSLFLTFLSRDVVIVVSLSAPVGIAMASGIGFQTLLQSRPEEQYRGRVLGAASTTTALLILIGQGAGALLAGAIGLLPVLNAACVLYVLAGLVGLALLPPSLTAASTPPAKTASTANT